MMSVRRLCVGVVVLSLVMAVSGCTGPKPEQVVTRFMDAMSKGETEKASRCLETSLGTALGFPMEESDLDFVLRVFFGGLTYQIGETKIDGDSASVESTITLPNFAGLANQMVPDILGAVFSALDPEGKHAEAQAILQETSDEAAADVDPTITKDLSINLRKRGGKWLIVFDEELETVLFGSVSIKVNVR